MEDEEHTSHTADNPKPLEKKEKLICFTISNIHTNAPAIMFSQQQHKNMYLYLSEAILFSSAFTNVLYNMDYIVSG